jgi:hypothetical protein
MINSQIKVTQKNLTNYIRVNLQAVADVGYALNLIIGRTDGILFHAGAGVSQTTIQTL